MQITVTMSDKDYEMFKKFIENKNALQEKFEEELKKAEAKHREKYRAMYGVPEQW